MTFVPIASPGELPKAATGIQGLDEITGGGLPRGRATLVCGSAGCGKTVFAIEFLVRGALEFGEPGVLMSFEETAEELAQNARSLGYDLDAMVAAKQLRIDFVRVERNEIQEAGDYDLEGLFVRLGYAIDSIGARRVVLDTIEALFSGLANQGVLRAELRRLFRWLKDRGVTAVITGERGEGSLTRHGLEEYVSDCVILLDHRVSEQVSTRRLRIVKYRGSTHETNEFPFLIDASGINVMPITAAGLQHRVSDERVSSGVPRLDAMLGGAGYYRGSTVLLTGTAGTGKTTLAASFADSVCAGGEHCLYFAFEESPHQLMRNLRSVGLDLGARVEHGLLRFHAVRPTMFGLETHLAAVHKAVRDFEPAAVVLDPVTTFANAGAEREAYALLTRLIDFLKSRQITVVMTSLTDGTAAEISSIGITSLVDTWLLLRDVESGGERNRALYVLKSRGMAHSNQIREFVLSEHGVDLLDVYLGPEGVLTGSMRRAQEAREQAALLELRRSSEARRRERDRRRAVLEARIAALRKEFEAEDAEAAVRAGEDAERETAWVSARETMARSRGAAIDRGDKPGPESAGNETGTKP